MLDKDQIDEWNEYWSEPPKSYPTPLEMTKHYQKVTGQEPDPELYERLIEEEFDEWSEIKDEPWASVPELKELADLVYVIYGYANASGWDLDEALCRVHSNNLGRMYQPDGSIKRRENGKIAKNKSYPKPDLSDLV
jgi:predicted HAD superfamily Cof-like phosphohydrolase